jgi:ubiquinone/menaquinone biosynthesis C-methylase UbiE
MMYEVENKSYWTSRTKGYSEVNQVELATQQREIWRGVIHQKIMAQFPNRPAETIHVLEVGTGPGFFAIILAEMGYRVTAVDYTPAMLEEAKRNAGAIAGRIEFLEMNAEQLTFADHSFDVVLSRNLTWNLPHPEQAYHQWRRVLKPGGLLLNFDANWYGYLYDEQKRAEYEADRQRTAERGVKDEYTCTDIDAMEAIARQVPLSAVHRPAWDIQALSDLGMHCKADEQIWQHVWSEEEKLNFSATPLFLVTAVRAS